MRGAGIATCLMEVSSIGVVQHRVQGIPYHLGVFTNLTRDHLDFHGTMAAYAAAKATLFQQLLRPVKGAPRALVCMDDPNWRLMHPPSDRWSYGFAAQADVRIVRANTTPLGTDIDLETPLGGVSIRSSLVGRVNALNCAAALGIGLLLGIELNAMAKGLALVARVPGRLEPIENTRGLTVLVDYAHTPDALGACLDAVRAVTKGALWVVFGCGGNRDAGKRPEMGAMAEQKADYVVITSDNPRTEDPMSIIEQVVAGCSWVPTQVQPDRALAIAYALSQAKPGDSVVIAGKGHETYQEIGTTRHLFDDRQVVRHLLEAL
jgi:UDP-N-acetylmuramoyl-L-alanyl-D-glutamate--2,6-diaminopimelate ligase